MTEPASAARVHDVDLFRGHKPHPTQARFLESTAPRKVYIGAVGTGKTEVLCWQAILLSHLFKPNVGVIGRYTYPELRDTTRKRFLEVADPSLIRTANVPHDGGGEIEWRCGGVTLFRNLDDPHKYASFEIGYLGIDEITECPENVYMMGDSRVGRAFTGDRRGTYAPLFGTGNPAGQDWVFKLFFSPDHSQETHAGFRPHPRENVDALPPGYYETISRGKPDWWVRRFVKGELAALEGLVWANFDEELHVIPDFPVPRPWSRYTGHDHGRRNPTACLWAAVDYDSNILAYREYQSAGPTPIEHTIAILARERGEPIADRYADPSMFSKILPGASGKWHSVADEYAEGGIELLPGDNSMGATLDRVRTLLWADPKRSFPDWHPRAGQTGAPRLFFMRSCRETISAVSSWRYKEYKQADLGLREEPVDFDDHLPDCLRYVCTAFPEGPERRVPRHEPTRAEWQIARKKRMYRDAVRAVTSPRLDADYV